MIVFAWSGFPQYAARCVGAFVRACPSYQVVVFATRPRVPVTGMEKLAMCPVYWIDSSKSLQCQLRSEFDVNLDRISILFENGWNIKPFNDLRDEVKKRGNPVVCMIDNNLQLYGVKILVEVVKAIRFRGFLSKHYDGYFVPGKAGEKLLSFYGNKKKPILRGYYSADNRLFNMGGGIDSRQKKVLYVGQFCKRKNVVKMIRAFMCANTQKQWTLELYGNGPLRRLIDIMAEKSEGCVKVYDFMQPECLAQKYKEAKIFCLPSMEEHWGLVVHEAALSGCALCLSNRVGAAEDMLCAENGNSFNPSNIKDIAEKMSLLMNMTDSEMLTAQKASLEKAKTASIEQFVRAVSEFIKMFV